MIITCCIVTKSNSIFFKRSLANIYYITSSLRTLILWNKMYQDFCCYNDLKDVTTRRRKRGVIILSPVARELEFYNGRRSFLAIEIHVGNGRHSWQNLIPTFRNCREMSGRVFLFSSFHFVCYHIFVIKFTEKHDLSYFLLD